MYNKAQYRMSEISPAPLSSQGDILLATKLHVPPARLNLVARPRLLERLRQGLDHRLILVSAPAGFGKTTLISSLKCQISNLNLAWVSLDEGDNDPIRFWAYVCAALQSQNGSLGIGAQTLLCSVQATDFENILTVLINDLAHLPDPLLLVLDDFHLIRSPVVIRSLAFLLDRMPSQFHLLILTRSDPSLPLARLRSRGQLLELRQDDLRFSTAEVNSFLNASMGLNLPPHAVEALRAKTEGWAAGLQMAATSLRGQEKVDELIDSFSGSNRYILDYLIEEVLKQQSQNIQEFLLKTSLLDSLCGPLCDAVLGDHVHQLSSITLEYLENNNLFIVPLDQDRRWYRYHQLFADLLKKRLRQSYSTEEAELHARASRWYEQNDLPSPAMEHAFQARDFARAARLLDQSAEAILNRGEYRGLLQWIQRLPEEQICAHLRLPVFKATILASTGQLQEAERCLQYVQERLPSATQDPGLQNWLIGRTATARALIAVFRGDRAGSRQAAQLALETLPASNTSPWRAQLLIALSHLSLAEGDLEAVRRNLVEAIEAGKLAGHAYLTLDASAHLTMTLWMQGRLREAGDVCQQGLQFVEQKALGHSLEASMLYLAWGFILCERHELDGAQEFVRRGLGRCRSANNPATMVWAYQMFIRLLIAQGDLAAAEEAVREADRLARQTEIPLWIECGHSALKAQVWIRQGKTEEAEAYLFKRGIIRSGEIQYPYHAEYAALGLLFRARGELDIAAQLFERLLHWAEAAGQQSWAISTLVQLALIHQARGKNHQAAQALAKAIKLADPEGYVQVFVDEGEALGGLISEWRSKIGDSRMRSFADQLLSAFGHETLLDSPRAAIRDPKSEIRNRPNPADWAKSEMVAPLSDRELQVLRLVADGLSNKEIAHQLCISLRTVKYHTNSIFTKLNVNSRTQAVSQARTLGLL